MIKKTKLTISGIAKKSIENIEIATAITINGIYKFLDTFKLIF